MYVHTFDRTKHSVLRGQSGDTNRNTIRIGSTLTFLYFHLIEPYFYII